MPIRKMMIGLKYMIQGVLSTKENVNQIKLIKKVMLIKKLQLKMYYLVININRIYLYLLLLKDL